MLLIIAKLVPRKTNVMLAPKAITYKTTSVNQIVRFLSVKDVMSLTFALLALKTIESFRVSAELTVKLITA